MDTPCFTASIKSFSKSATSQELKSGQMTNYTDRMRSSSLKTPQKACLPLKRNCTNTSSRTTSTQGSTHKEVVAKAKSVKEPPKKRKFVLLNGIEAKSSNFPEIVVEDHKSKVSKISVTKKPITVQEEESVVMKVISAQLQSIVEKDAIRANEAIQTKINEANLAMENETLRKNIEAVERKAHMDMIRIEEEHKATLERLRMDNLQKEEEERKEKTRRDMKDALLKVKVETQEKANKEMEEFRERCRREYDEINRKKDEELENSRRELKESKEKQEEDRERTRREQCDGKKKIEEEEALQRTKTQYDEAMNQKAKEYQEALRIKDEELKAANFQLKQEKEAKKVKKREKKFLNRMARLMESKKEEEGDKENKEAQRLKYLKEELQMKNDHELQQVQILQMRDELKEKDRRRQQNDDDEHLKQRTNNEIMRRMGLVNVGKAEHDLDVQRKNLFEKN
jgi:hypothetical protein